MRLFNCHFISITLFQSIQNNIFGRDKCQDIRLWTNLDCFDQFAFVRNVQAASFEREIIAINKETQLFLKGKRPLPHHKYRADR